MKNKNSVKKPEPFQGIALPEGVEIGCRTYSFTQDSDCCDEGHEGQFIDIEVCDGGGGEYLVLKTERWAVDDIDEFARFLKSLILEKKSNTSIDKKTKTGESNE